MKAMVLGCGLVGKLIAKDLERDSYFQVSVADIDQEKLNKITSDTDFLIDKVSKLYFRIKGREEIIYKTEDIISKGHNSPSSLTLGNC